MALPKPSSSTNHLLGQSALSSAGTRSTQTAQSLRLLRWTRQKIWLQEGQKVQRKLYSRSLWRVMRNYERLDWQVWDKMRLRICKKRLGHAYLSRNLHTELQNAAERSLCDRGGLPMNFLAKEFPSQERK